MALYCTKMKYSCLLRNSKSFPDTKSSWAIFFHLREAKSLTTSVALLLYINSVHADTRLYCSALFWLVYIIGVTLAELSLSWILLLPSNCIESVQVYTSPLITQCWFTVSSILIHTHQLTLQCVTTLPWHSYLLSSTRCCPSAPKTCGRTFAYTWTGRCLMSILPSDWQVTAVCAPWLWSFRQHTARQETSSSMLERVLTRYALWCLAHLRSFRMMKLLPS